MVNKPETLKKIELKIRNQSSLLSVCLINTEKKVEKQNDYEFFPLSLKIP